METKIKSNYKLQHQLSNGDWVDIRADRIDEFLSYCIENNSEINSQAEAIAAMEFGHTLRNDPSDWYSNCRLHDHDKEKRQLEELYKQDNEELKKQKSCSSCGQTGIAGRYPFSTIACGSVCDDCI